MKITTATAGIADRCFGFVLSHYFLFSNASLLNAIRAIFKSRIASKAGMGF